MNPSIAADLPSASHRATNDLVFQLARPHLRAGAQILDLGCGRGHMTRRMARRFTEQGLDPAVHVVACDISEDAFQAHEARFVRLDARQPLPFEPRSLDLIVSVEVIEHLPNPYGFLQQCRDLLRPGGTLLLTTPNVGNLQSRVRSLFMGLPSLYEMPSTNPANAGRLCGHIMPLNWAFLSYGLRLAGFAEVTHHVDQRKSTSTALGVLLGPLIWLGGRRLDAHTRAYDAAVHAENRCTIDELNSWRLLTARSLVVQARAP